MPQEPVQLKWAKLSFDPANVCDAALRAHFGVAQAPNRFPYPTTGV